MSDTAANISAAFDALNGNADVDKIVVTDSATHEVTITAAQAVADTTALGELYQSNGTTPAHVEVSDIAANISSALDALNGNSHVDKIVVSDSATHEVAITAGQAGSDSTALGELYQSDGTTHAHVEVLDIAANISSALDALNANTHVDKIVVSDSATHEVTLTAAQVAADTTALGELYQSNGTAPAHAEVLDTAANISAAFNTLNGNTQVDKIVVSDSAAHEITIAINQLGSEAIIGKLYQSDGATPAHVEVLATAANIAPGFDFLNIDTKVNKIVVSDSSSSEVNISVAQLTGDSIALGELFQADGITPAKVAIRDTAANITSALGSLNSATQVDNIVISNNAALGLSVSQLVTDTVALGELHNQNGSNAVVNISDTVANVASDIDQLETDVAQIGSVSFTNGGTPALNVTQTQATNDAGLLAKIVGAYDLHVTGVVGHPYSSYTNFYNGSGVLTLTTDFNNNGSITDIAHTNGLTLTGTSNADTLQIAAGHSDIVNGGAGADHFVFTSVTESTSSNYDTIVGFNASVEKFDFSALSLHVTGVNAAVTSGVLSTANFDTNLASAINSTHLGANHAVLFTATTGSLAGDTFLIVDANGHAGYQAGQDFVFLLTSANHLGSFGTGDFI